MCILKLSATLLILVLMTFTKTQAVSRACQRKENHFATLDLTKDAISKAKDVQPTCDNDSKSVSSNSSECGGKEKIIAYLNFALNMIDNAKDNYFICDEANNFTKDVTDESKEIAKVVIHKKPVDCLEVLENEETKSGEYMIWPKNPQFENLQLKVYCDMDTEGGGWTVLQRRGKFSNQVDFNRNWSDYKKGFGNISEEFWIGNDNIFALTNQGRYSLRFDMENFAEEYRFATYSAFRIEDEKEGYKVHFDQYSGTAGDGIKQINYMQFSTKDRENPRYSGTTCAATRKGGWWYNYCGQSNPNGINLPGARKDHSKMNWYPFTDYDSLLSIEMKIRSEKPTI